MKHWTFSHIRLINAEDYSNLFKSKISITSIKIGYGNQRINPEENSILEEETYRFI
ncbi:TPA: hypothetical protein HA371_04145 [Candidatus Woesearchaeota archaeon]|nr:hypothetical protein [Candidatus Woesearchaeota archaeon]